MEKDSFFLRLSKSRRAFILIIVVLISSFVVNDYINNYIISEFYPEMIMSAEQLNFIPDRFIPFSNLDNFGIQTIFNSSNKITISYRDFVEILQIAGSYESLFVKYNDNYYDLRFDNTGKDRPVIPIQIQILSYAINFVSITSIILITIIIIINILKIINRAFPFG